jgi:hypothetical protein
LGRIYVGQDLTGSIACFGSPNSKLVAADFTPEQRRDVTARKEILWQEELILALRSNDPAVGYNRTAKPQSLNATFRRYRFPHALAYPPSAGRSAGAAD